jgi:small-conductance mechanosensitive channel
MLTLLSWVGFDAGADSVQMLAKGLRIVLVLALCWGVLRILERSLVRLRSRMRWRNRDAESERRAETLLQAIRYVVSGVVVVIALLFVLGEFGVSIAPLLATAGVAGVALGFGTQTLIKDCLNGFFLLLEDQLRQGDIVEVAGKNGVVEEITLRYVRLRDYEGAVHFVPCGSISVLSNRSRGFAYAVIDLQLGAQVDVGHAFSVLREVAAGLRSDPDFGPRILEDLEIAGVDELAEGKLTVRSRLKVRSLEQLAVRREFLRRLQEQYEAGTLRPRENVSEARRISAQAKPPTAHNAL